MYVSSRDIAARLGQRADDTIGLRQTINDEGVWRIRRRPRSPEIEVFKVEEVGHGNIMLEEFLNWRITLSLNQARETDGA